VIGLKGRQWLLTTTIYSFRARTDVLVATLDRHVAWQVPTALEQPAADLNFRRVGLCATRYSGASIVVFAERKA